MTHGLTVLEICAGAGGQSLGLELAGFIHVGAVDNDPDACETLRLNRPEWEVIEDDVAGVYGKAFKGIDLLAGGVPCPPFSIAGKQLGEDDERDLFPQALRLIRETQPRAVLLENVRGLASARFDSYRSSLLSELEALGYAADWRILNACDFGVPQLRPRFLLVALRPDYVKGFLWPDPGLPPYTVGEAIGDLVGSRGWPGAARWRANARGIAPTIVGGSKKHGGPDLGPTRARAEWQKLGVDGRGIADVPPGPEFPLNGQPRLTNRMVARIQGFPDRWEFAGGKTSAYRQVGNAFPPPVAMAVGSSIACALAGKDLQNRSQGQARLLELGVAAAPVLSRR
jgi:DNA (cytosine-5)-methyltransferase 1